eukprot:6186046-Pleurochrysis_carterae.AAC.2
MLTSTQATAPLVAPRQCLYNAHNMSVMAHDACRTEDLVIHRQFRLCNICARRPGLRTCTWAWAVITASSTGF